MVMLSAEGKLNKEQQGEWWNADFHVHTPASYDFQGATDLDEAGQYIDVLRQARAAQLDLIVIADHATLEGYWRLRGLWTAAEERAAWLRRSGLPEDATVNETLALFSAVAILPGVELEIDRGIHMVVIFQPAMAGANEEAGQFIRASREADERRGSRKVLQGVRWELEAMLEWATAVGAIVIAAHVDEEKGLWKVTEAWKGSRPGIFCHRGLRAMEFVGTGQRDNIIQIYEQPLFQRETPVAFVQSSDYHGPGRGPFGLRRTHVLMDNVERTDAEGVFVSVDRAFANPDERISAPELPDAKQILKQLRGHPAVADLMMEGADRELAKWVCAQANSGGGTIVVGRTPKGSYVGIPGGKGWDAYMQVWQSLKRHAAHDLGVEIRTYAYSGDRWVCAVHTKKRTSVAQLKEPEEVYLLRSGKPVRASVQDIATLVEQNLLERYSRLSETSRVAAVSRRLTGIEDTIDIIPLLQRMHATCRQLAEVVAEPASRSGLLRWSDVRDEVDLPFHGYASGEIGVVPMRARPRRSDSYTRLSIPKGRWRKPRGTLQPRWEPPMTGERIVVSDGGGVFFDANDAYIVGEYSKPLIYSDLAIDYPHDLKFIFGYLKSSLAIWYSQRCLSRRSPLLGGLRELLVPFSVPEATVASVSEVVDALLHMEHSWLLRETELRGGFVGDEMALQEAIQRLEGDHNQQASKLLAKLDELFYSLFGITEDERSLVERVLWADGLLLPASWDVGGGMIKPDPHPAARDPQQRLSGRKPT